jgi:hypothetical protein
MIYIYMFFLYVFYVYLHDCLRMCIYILYICVHVFTYLVTIIKHDIIVPSSSFRALPLTSKTRGHEIRFKCNTFAFSEYGSPKAVILFIFRLFEAKNRNTFNIFSPAACFVHWEPSFCTTPPLCVL